MIKIYVNTPSWSFGASTDRNLQKRMKILSKIYPDLEFYYPHNKVLSLWINIKHLYSSIKRRVIRKKPIPSIGWILKTQKAYNELELKYSNCDIIYSQGIMPKRTFNKPVLLDLVFFEPEVRGGCIINKESKDRFKTMCNIIRDLSIKNGIYNLRSNYSTNLVNKYVDKSNAYKFKNLPFLLPELKCINDQEIQIKHNLTDNGKGKIIILFCGAQAKRKGLELVLESYLKIRSSKTELHIISSLSDGNIIIPKFDDIIYHGSLSHEETIIYFKKAHIYIMPSYYESFGLTYLEAMANGAIVVARNYEPQREIVNYGKCGFLVDLNINSCVNKLNYIINLSDNERTNIALSAKKYFEEKFSFEKVHKEWYKAIVECYNLGEHEKDNNNNSN